jgi:tRNA(Arg) A34 adenosine deaminase TadA
MTAPAQTSERELRWLRHAIALFQAKARGTHPSAHSWWESTTIIMAGNAFAGRMAIVRDTRADRAARGVAPHPTRAAALATLYTSAEPCVMCGGRLLDRSAAWYTRGPRLGCWR